MRIIAAIVFILQVSLTGAQQPAARVLTLNDALAIAAQRSFPDSIVPASQVIKSAWYTMLYRIHKYAILSDFEKTLDDLERVADLRYKAGEEDLFHTSSMLGILYETRTEAASAYNEISISHNLIRQYLFTGYDIAPADSNLYIYEIDKSSKGYETEIADSANTYRLFIINSNIENKRLELDNLFIRLQYYQSYALKHSETVMATSRARYKAEDIEYTELIALISEAFRIRLDYIDILNRYNQCAIQLEYYEYK